MGDVVEHGKGSRVSINTLRCVVWLVRASHSRSWASAQQHAPPQRMRSSSPRCPSRKRNQAREASGKGARSVPFGLAVQVPWAYGSSDRTDATNKKGRILVLRDEGNAS